MAFLTNQEKRAEILLKYPGERYAAKVRLMSDQQVHAIWARLQETKSKEVPKESEPDDLTLF